MAALLGMARRALTARALHTAPAAASAAPHVAATTAPLRGGPWLILRCGLADRASAAASISPCRSSGSRLGLTPRRFSAKSGCSSSSSASAASAESARATGGGAHSGGSRSSYDGSGWRFGSSGSSSAPFSSPTALIALLGGAGAAAFLWSRSRLANEGAVLSPLPLPGHRDTAAADAVAAAAAAAAADDPLADHKLPPLIKEHRDKPFFKRMWFYLRIMCRGVLLASLWIPVLSLGLVLPQRVWVRMVVRLLERCGAVFIKLGQWAATRPDLFPAEACQEFAKLQASVKPHAFKKSVQACKKNFGPNLRAEDGSTLELSPRVLGSGSMGQVHFGHIVSPDGQTRTEVAIKVLHPGIHSRVNLDLTLLYFVAKGVTMIPYADLQWLSVPEMLIQFTEFMGSHLDLKQEAENMNIFREHFANNRSIYFPQPMFPFVGPQVLVQELAHGIPLAKFLHNEEYASVHRESNQDLKSRNQTIRQRITRQQQVNPDGTVQPLPQSTSAVHTELARLGLQMYLHMLITDNFVHSDLHPGNLLVQFPHRGPESGEHADPASIEAESAQELRSEDVRLVVLDSGLVSTLSQPNRVNFLSLFGALILRDGRLAARLMLDNAPRQACPDPQALQDDMHVIVSAIPLESLASVDLGRLLSEVMNCVRRHRVKLESDFASLIISLAIIEGIGRQLDPGLSLFHQAVPTMLKNKECRSILLRTAGWKACAKLGLQIAKEELHLVKDHPQSKQQ